MYNIHNMNNIIFQTIRAGAILGVAFFALANEAFAAPSPTPVTVNSITGTSATIVGHVSNPHKSTAVWFEIYNNFGAPMAVGAQPPLYDNGIGITFEYPLKDLNPGQTYSYRSAAMEGGVTVYSPTSSFTTTSPKIVNTVSSQLYSGASTQNQTQTTASKTAQTATKTVAVKQNTTTKVATAPVANKESSTNGNSAAVIGAGNSLLPNTLISWLVLLAAILIVVLVGRLLYEAPERRRKEREYEEERTRREAM